jgi:hypothetical protein
MKKGMVDEDPKFSLTEHLVHLILPTRRRKRIRSTSDEKHLAHVDIIDPFERLEKVIQDESLKKQEDR